MPTRAEILNASIEKMNKAFLDLFSVYSGIKKELEGLDPENRENDSKAVLLALTKNALLEQLIKLADVSQDLEQMDLSNL